MSEHSERMKTDSTSLCAAEMRAAVIEEGRNRKQRVRDRLAAWVKCRREHGNVPIHVDLLLRRARANHAKAVRKARMVHAAFPAQRTNTRGSSERVVRHGFHHAPHPYCLRCAHYFLAEASPCGQQGCEIAYCESINGVCLSAVLP